jgi:Protein of unknown function (DUF3987)
MSQQTNDRPSGPSAQERRLALAAQIVAGRTSLDSDWPEWDASLLENRRAPVPSFPLDLLPACWRDWVNDTACSAGAPADYVAQSLLAAVAGLCGAGVSVCVSPAWSEPLVLWQMLVGGPSSGKSAALAPVRRLLAAIEQEFPADAGAQGRRRIVVTDSAVEALAEAVDGNPRGVVLWRDDAAAWLRQFTSGDTPVDWVDAWAAGALSVPGRPTPVEIGRFPVSMLGTIQPDRLEETLPDGDERLLARFLYSWPDLPLYCPLGERTPPDDDNALDRLRRIARKARTPDEPLVLTVDRLGAQALDGFLAALQAERRHVDGLEAAWMGKGGSSVVRLAGMIELLAWSGLAASGPPGHLGRDHVEAAVGLWQGYFRPHAKALFDRVVPTQLEQRVRRAARWLTETGLATVSREDIRRDALLQSAKAIDVDCVLHRLEETGFLRPMAIESSRLAGPRARRWQVNPALAAPPNGLR